MLLYGKSIYGKSIIANMPKPSAIPDKSLVGGKVPKCITSQLAQLKILLLLYILFKLNKTLPNISVCEPC